MRLAQLFFLALAGAKVGGEADHARLLAVLVEEHGSRDEYGNAASVLGLEHALAAGRRAAAFAHLDQDVPCAILAIVELSGGVADNIFGAIAQQCLGAFIEEDDVALLVGGNDSVGRALDKPREVALGFLDLGIGGESGPAPPVCAW